MKVKLDSGARMPTRAYKTSTGWDLYCLESVTLKRGEVCKVRTGVSLELPPGVGGLILDKSGLASKGLKTMGGVIDNEYRGELVVLMISLVGDHFFEAGSKVAQIWFHQVLDVNMEEGELTLTQRGSAGFGSTGV